MEPITFKDYIQPKKTNKYWIVASLIAEITTTKPNRWLRTVKNNDWAVQRALTDFKEAKRNHVDIKNRAAFFTFLLKKYRLQSQ